MAYKWETLEEGIRVRYHETRKHGVKPDVYFTLRLQIEGVRREEGLGWASQGWTVQRAREQLVEFRKAARTGEGETSLQAKRMQAAAKRKAEAEKPTIAKIWDKYQADNKAKPGLRNDIYTVKHLTRFLDMPVESIRTPQVDGLRKDLSDEGKAPQTVRNALELLRRLVNYAVKREMCDMPPRLRFDMPKVDNAKTECLTPEQAKALLLALDEEADQNLANLVRLALATGMRRGALLALEWGDVDFRKGFITLQGKTAKKGRTEQIPLNDNARVILGNTSRHSTSPYIFCTKDGSKRSEIRFILERVKKKAGLPASFRPLHGLRHTFASWLASSGQVDMFTLQKLLTHDSPAMTQRYSHLSDEAMQRAAAVSNTLYDRAVNAEPTQPPQATGAKILPFRNGNEC